MSGAKLKPSTRSGLLAELALDLGRLGGVGEGFVAVGFGDGGLAAHVRGDVDGERGGPGAAGDRRGDAHRRVVELPTLTSTGVPSGWSEVPDAVSVS